MIVFAGWGWLTYVIAVASIAIGGVIVDALRLPGDTILWAGIGWAVVGALLQYLVGRAVNSRPTPHGRTWHDSHTTAGRPMQDCTGIHVFLGLTIVAIRAGQLTTPVVGWLLFAAGIAVAVFVGSWASHAALPRSRAAGGTVETRKTLARANGWRYRGGSGESVRGWSRRYKGIVTLTTDGVVTGEWRGRAFVVLDVMASRGFSPRRHLQTRRTVVRVALNAAPPVPRAVAGPVGTPIVLDEVRPWEPVGGAPGGGLRVVSADGDLASRYLTPAVLAAAAAAGLRGFQVDDGELVYAGEPGRVIEPREVLRLVHTLVDLALMVPARPSSTGAEVPRQRTSPEERSTFRASEARPAGPRVITTRHVRLTVDRERLVAHRRSVRPADGWTEHLAVEWAHVRELLFDTQGLDPVVSLFALVDDGPRRYVADANHLSRPEWSTFAAVVADCTGGRIRVDLARRDP
ncbi:hypothetical protein ACFFX1_49895 [Dactylosporangium sucinum]|uniref:Uncharacterized protein n=1 Tax=Dactylosporangium sucinum TaxID=1424081 RepID=A0A917UAX6_9ACTN|nr:hypothetical protein [Dactylosporangium sucinum]GGM65664.1 hypothetical protein GCM10007977_079070 [Dactylosporangium sucinum]